MSGKNHVSSLPTDRSRPGSASHSGKTPGSSRPASGSSGSTTLLNKQLKTFAFQYEVLHRNHILAILAEEIPWKNLFDLCTIKFSVIGEMNWHEGETASEMIFILYGGFSARCMERVSNSPGSVLDQDTRHVEKVLRPGDVMLAYNVNTKTPLKYSVITTKFKSIMLSLPMGKYYSMKKQLSAAVKDKIEMAIIVAENQILKCLELPLIKLAASAYNCKAHSGKTNKYAAKDKLSQTQGAHPKKGDVAGMIAAASDVVTWASLGVVEKSMEYEVDSSLLVLRRKQTENESAPQRGFERNTLAGSSHSRSALALAKAHEHTDRRLQSIKLPSQVDAFPMSLRKSASAHVLPTSSDGTHFRLHQSKSSMLDVVRKERVGRLLDPIKKVTLVSKSDLPSNNSQERSLHVLVGKQVLVTNRLETFRESE